MDKLLVGTEPTLTWRFPARFWAANTAELFERAAFYGMFIALTLYLSRVVEYNDVEAGDIAAIFAAMVYLMPMFMGALADKIGFRHALMMAFALLAAGYFLLGAWPGRSSSLVGLGLVVLGAAIVKPVISGTAALCSDEANRARAFSIFYLMVNIGGFTGKTVAAPLRERLGLEYIMYYASAMAVCGFIVTALIYRHVDTPGTAKRPGEVLLGLFKVILNIRFMALIVIIAGFWLIQGQLYASLTKYILRLQGEAAKPEWLANINPFVVVLLVVPITHFVRHFKPVVAIGIGMFIIPLAALIIALSPVLERVAGPVVDFGAFSLQPVTVMAVVGIAMIGLAECFLSPKFLEFASKQAPSGEEGLYMGYQNLTVFFAWLSGFTLSGRLLERYCPDPATLPDAVRVQWETAIATGGPLPEAYASAHHIWFVFAAIGATAFLALLVYWFVTSQLDRRRGADV